MSTKSIFAVTNHHSDDCGEPPLIDGATPGDYRGYFENEHGEQAIFIYDRRKREGTLYLGDAGWETPHPVRNGVAHDLMLGDQEKAWLLLCWKAATFA